MYVVAWSAGVRSAELALAAGSAKEVATLAAEAGSSGMQVGASASVAGVPASSPMRVEGAEAVASSATGVFNHIMEQYSTILEWLVALASGLFVAGEEGQPKVRAHAITKLIDFLHMV